MQQRHNWGPLYEEEQFYVKEHDWYYTPNEYRVMFILQLKRLDIKNVHVAREMARFFYYKMVQDKTYVDPFYEDKTLLEGEDLEKAEQKEGFYEQLWKMFVPGMSPLDKAINALLLMKRKNNGGAVSPEAMTGRDLTEVFNGVPDRVMFENDTYNELMEQRGSIEDWTEQIDMLNAISVVGEFGKSFEIKKTVYDKRVTNSKIHRNKRIVEYGELVNSQLYQRMLPNYEAKLITKDLVVNMPIERQESKQKIIFIVDFSGSMSDENKQKWVLAILADRLSYVMKEECEMYFSFFLTQSELKNNYFKWHHLKNKKDALDFYKNFKTNPNGGDTEVGHIVEMIRAEIMDNHKLFNLNIDLSEEQPEILVINDGQDSVKTDKLTWKTNAITLFGENKELEKLCNKTGGKYVSITKMVGQK